MRRTIRKKFNFLPVVLFSFKPFLFQNRDMPKFHVKKTSLGEDEKSLVFKGKVIEGPINKGMTLEIPITEAATISMKIYDIVHFEKQRDESKRVGLIIDFAEEPEALEFVMSLNIAEEELTVN